MKSFSERKGIRQVSEALQTESMSIELRSSLWNALDIRLWSRRNFVYGPNGGHGDIEHFSGLLWFHYFKKPMDERPGYGRPDRGRQIHKVIRDEFFSSPWNGVYDFLEFVVRTWRNRDGDLEKFLNVILERELAGYRLIDGHVVDITSEQEKAALEEALGDTKFSSAGSHLSRALDLLSDRKSPDYRNSIKESISAVEAMARTVAGNPKATLGDALKALEKNGRLHTALKEGFSKLYGYASDEDGIRHAMLDEPNLTQADAKYFLLSCTSFVNYLKSSL